MFDSIQLVDLQREMWLMHRDGNGKARREKIWRWEGQGKDMERYEEIWNDMGGGGVDMEGCRPH